MGTLRHHLQRPLGIKRDISAAKCKDLAGMVKASANGGGVSADELALEFYFYNHLVALVRKKYALDEPLPEEVEDLVERYYERSSRHAIRMFYYLVLICVRETRHLMNKSEMEASTVKEFGKVAYDFMCSLPDSATDAPKRFHDAPPNCSIGKVCGAMRHVFYKGMWHGGYGGKKWGMVADCLNAFVIGAYSPEMMVDTAFALSHNNGPIFNKAMQFTGYSTNFTKLLDVQRSGQIPELVRNGGQGILVPKVGQMQDLLIAEKVFGKFADEVDWYKVEALGGMTNVKQEQVKQGIKSPYMNAMQAAEAKKIAAANQKIAEKKKMAQLDAIEKAKNYYEYKPGRYVKKVKMVRK